MKLYSTLYENRNMLVQLCISPRNKNNRPDCIESDTLITKYKSKSGSESLIFNPTISLILQSKESRKSAMIPSTLIYRIGGVLSKIYEDILTNDKLYIRDDKKRLIIDKKLAEKKSRKISIFTRFIIFTPSILDTDNGGDYGITLAAGGEHILTMSHAEARDIIELIEHLDVQTYTMLAAIVDKTEAMDRKLDDIYMMLLDIKRNGAGHDIKSNKSEIIEWKPIETHKLF